MSDIHADRVLILDFGSQYTQLIARRVRELGVYSEIYAWDADPAAIESFKPRAIILSGSPESVYEAKGPEVPRNATKSSPNNRTRSGGPSALSLSRRPSSGG